MTDDDEWKRPRRILVATRGNPKLLRFAFEPAESRRAEVLLLFVRHLAVSMPGWSPSQGDPDDAEARQRFETARAEAGARHLPLHCLFAVSYDIADTIFDFAATYGVETVIPGTTQRSALWDLMKGDMLRAVVFPLRGLTRRRRHNRFGELDRVACQKGGDWH